MMKFLSAHKMILVVITGIILVVLLLVSFPGKQLKGETRFAATAYPDNFDWQPPDIGQLIGSKDADLIFYGRELIVHTSYYLGPKGISGRISNGMNCQNCHLDGGTRLWANNFSAVASTYPKYRERSNSVENVYRRVNDCFQRSLNAPHGLDTNSREMQAIVAYMNWLGKKVPPQVKPVGAGIHELNFPDRPADPVKGKMIYQDHCSRCHGENGQGILNIDSSAYTYPPLWGPDSYTTAAGMYRVSRLAGFARHNMPFDAPAFSSQISDEEAWDVAAFINSQPRPHKSFPGDWPDIKSKPFDYPVGPYADDRTEQEHKLGPWRRP